LEQQNIIKMSATKLQQHGKSEKVKATSYRDKNKTPNGNTLWQDSIKLEIKALTDLEHFDFKDPDHKPQLSIKKRLSLL
jgi:hypothetical protein